MGQATSTHARPRSGQRRLSGRSALAAVTLLGLALSFPATAQESSPPVNTEPPGELCRVFAIDAAEGEFKDLRASCRGRGLMLGAITRFESMANEALQATLVDAYLGSARRVLLLTVQDGGLPLVEDLTGQIALAAGRGPMSAIDGLEIDLSRYVEGGSIAVHRAAASEATGSSGEIDLAEQIALERARRGMAAAPN